MIFFSELYFHKFKLDIIWNYFMTKIILISKKISFGTFENRAKLNSPPGLNRGLSSKFLSQRNADYAEFI